MSEFVGTRDDLLDPTSVRVFPNPVSDLLTIEWNKNDISPQALHLLDMSGRLIKSESVESNHVELNVSELTAGIYFIEMQTADGVLVKKVLVQ